MNVRSRNQVGAFQNVVSVFVDTVAGTAKGAGVRGRDRGNSRKSAHVDTDKLLRRYAHKVRQRAIDAKNIMRLVVDNDEVADSVEHFHPVTVRLLHAREQAGVFQSNAGV